MSLDSENRDLHYREYLRLGEILNAQTPRSEPDNLDELHFIITHQALELWFKLILHNARKARDYIADGAWSSATLAMKRLTSVADAVLVQMRTLRCMPPQAFHGFRDSLGSASGVQSSQFREIEVLCGLRDPKYLESLKKYNGGRMPAAIGELLNTPSISEVLSEAARRAGVDWVDVYRDHERSRELYLLAEQMIDYDQVWHRWRCEHIELVERVLGNKRIGTAGSSMSYLHETLEYRFFPFLWDARNRLGPMEASK